MVIERILAARHWCRHDVAADKFINSTIVARGVTHDDLESRWWIIHVDVPVAHAAMDLDFAVHRFRTFGRARIVELEQPQDRFDRMPMIG